jgi:hypothetical protein
MKNPLVIAIAAVAFTLCGIAKSPAQTASFTFNDGSGVGNAGNYTVGETITFDVFLNFTPGGNVANLAGLSYWLQQTSGPSPSTFSITNRDLTGSLFTDAQTPSMTYPQAMTPANASDLGAALASPAGLGAGTYFIARISVAIGLTAANGVYTFGTTFALNKTSVISDNQGHTFAIPEATYTVRLVPETGSTLALLGLSTLVLTALASRQKMRA